MARVRYSLRSYRRTSDGGQRHKRQVEPSTEALGDLAAPSRMEDPALLEKKRSVVEAALARAKRKAGLARPATPRVVTYQASPERPQTVE